MVVGYTTGVFDLFHIGHVNLLRNAKALCDKLVVGVTSDDLVAYKSKRSAIPYHERIEVVRACRYVDVAIPQEELDKVDSVRKIGAEYLFVGDDWYGDERWKEMEARLDVLGVKVVYFPYTKGTSSTLINETLVDLRTTKAP